jgi:hypothetical protein
VTTIIPAVRIHVRKREVEMLCIDAERQQMRKELYTPCQAKDMEVTTRV